MEEIPFDEGGNLSLDIEPKLASALKSPEKYPIEINKANFHELIRIPGIGPKSARRILKHRVRNKIHTIEELKGIGVNMKSAASFILIGGKQPKPLQLELWSGNPAF